MDLSASVMTQTLPAVEGAQLSPVTCDMTNQVLEGMFPSLFEQFQGPRSSHNPSEGEGRRHQPLLALKTILGGFEATFGPATSSPSPRKTDLTEPPSPP